jgi:hypothetical protein
MAISVTCPRCGRLSRAAERAAGAAVLCPGCGNRFTAGGAEPAAAEAPRSNDAPRPAGGSPRPRRAAVLVTAAALACAAAVVWAYRGHVRETRRQEEQRPSQEAVQENLRQQQMLDEATRVYSGWERRGIVQPNRKRGTGR